MGVLKQSKLVQEACHTFTLEEVNKTGQTEMVSLCVWVYVAGLGGAVIFRSSIARLLISINHYSCDDQNCYREA